MSKVEKIIIIDDEKYYHDTNVVGLILLFFFAGVCTGPIIAAIWLAVFR